MHIDVEKLVSLDPDSLDDVFSWVDWRQDDTEVALQFAGQIINHLSVTSSDNLKTLTLTTDTGAYIVPLTHTGADRYVVLSSCAECFKDTHEVWLHRASLEDDTHGFLVLTKSESKLLQDKYSQWTQQHLRAFKPGYDHFHNVDIPYLHHENRLKRFEQQYAKIAAEQALYEARFSSPPEHSTTSGLVERIWKKFLLGIQILVILGIALGLYLKFTEPDCKVRIDGKCIVYQDR
ncbi:MAG: hypothetical protein R3227_09915 [Reinekea sp.]|nr:hypothetical protein [Reinekea sp.]